MREIKFRAWDAGESEMYYGITVSNGNAQHPDTGKEKYDWELMQFTGNKDHDGKEIFEGDIIAGFTSSENDFIEYGLSEEDWYESPIVVRWSEIFNGFFPFAAGNTMRFNQCGIKVVGNIHENPELLED